MADPIETLMSEHRIIERVLDALEAAADKELPASFYERALDFLQQFADACHHGKEEERLFPVLEERGVPREAGPIGVMCHEHVIGRGHIQRMREYARLGKLDAVRRESLEYVALLRQHIQKEDQVLFVMARGVLSDEDTRRLAREFDEVDGATRPLEKYGAVAAGLAEEVAGA